MSWLLHALNVAVVLTVRRIVLNVAVVLTVRRIVLHSLSEMADGERTELWCSVFNNSTGKKDLIIIK